MNEASLPLCFFLVRTRGNRNTMLVRALKSIFDQKWPVQIILLNHSTANIDLSAHFSESELKQIKIVRIENLSAKRGAPLNVGLQLALEQTQTHPQYLAILDDDDIVYPGFLSTLVPKSQQVSKTLVYGSSLKRVDGADAVPAFEYRPTLELFVNNFIPINTYVIDLLKLKQRPVKFDENLDVLEDWKFLIDLVLNGHEFGYADAVVSEFSIHTDGSNSLNIDSVGHWERCEKLIEQHVRRHKIEMQGDLLMDFGTFFKNNQKRGVIVPKYKDVLKMKSLAGRVFRKIKRLLTPA